MKCPFCASERIQFRARNNNTYVVKYKCLNCNQIFQKQEHKEEIK